MSFNMIFAVIYAVILLIALITLMYNIIIGVRTNDDKLIVICGIGAVPVGMLFVIVLGSILFNI